MKTQGLFLGLILSLVGIYSSAQQAASPRLLAEIPEYAAVTSTRKVLVVYSPSVSDRDILSIIKSHEGISAYQMQKPLIAGRYLITVDVNVDLGNLKLALESHEEILNVTPWLKDAQGNEYGILQELYIKPKSFSDVYLLENIVKEYGGIWKGERADMPEIFEAEFSKSSSYNAWEMALFLNTLPQVEFADVNFGFFPQVYTNDSLFNRQWALKNNGGALQWNGTVGADMDVVNAWTISTGDPTIKVAIMDSGIDTLHPDLIDNLLPGYDATGHNSKGYPNTNFPSDGHGTACAGIVAAKGDNNIGVAGVAYNSKIIPVKMFVYIDTNVVFPGIIDTMLYEIPYSETAYMIGGINWARQTANADIMSNSWGIPAGLLPFAPINQPTVTAAIDNASQQGRNGKGCIMIFSSGNDNGPVIWPSDLPSTISVGATTNKDKRASFSNYGENLDVSAPGVQVTTTDMLGANGFAAQDYMLDFGGTSAACPNVAGVAALILSIKPEFTFSQVKALLRVSAERVGGYAYDSTTTDGNWSEELGYGRVNAFQALSWAPFLSLVESNDKNFSVSLFPNPTIAEIQITTNGFETGQLNYEVLDLSGKIVMNGKYFSQQDEQITTISVANLNAGMYCFRLRGNNQSTIIKFVKN